METLPDRPTNSWATKTLKWICFRSVQASLTILCQPRPSAWGYGVKSVAPTGRPWIRMLLHATITRHNGVVDQRDVWGLGVGRSRAAPLVLLNLSSTSSQADGLGWHRIAPLGLPRPDWINPAPQCLMKGRKKACLNFNCPWACASDPTRPQCASRRTTIGVSTCAHWFQVRIRACCRMGNCTKRTASAWSCSAPPRRKRKSSSN